jgi:hypothetical protein
MRYIDDMVISATDTALEQIFDSLGDCLTPEVAKRILEIDLAPGAQEHIDELAKKANSGTLTVGEREQYEKIVEAIDLLGILQAKARFALSRQSA